MAALHALARFVAERSPEHIVWCGQIRTIPFKKTIKAVIASLTKRELDTLLAAPDRQTRQGERDYALLVFFYNSGARADEAAQLVLRDLHSSDLFVRIVGKGKKERQCPLWHLNYARSSAFSTPGAASFDIGSVMLQTMS